MTLRSRLILSALFANALCFGQLPDWSQWNWVQPEGASLSLAGQWPVLSFLGNSGDQHERMFLTALPAPPFTVTVGFVTTTSDATQQSSATLILRNSTTDQGLAFADEYEFGYGEVYGCNNGDGPHLVGSVHLPQIVGVSAQAVQLALSCQVRLFTTRAYLRIVDDGTHRTLYSSRDDMASWVQEYQEASGAFATFNQVGIAGFTLEGAQFSGFLVTVIYWSLTTP